MNTFLLIGLFNQVNFDVKYVVWEFLYIFGMSVILFQENIMFLYW